MNRNRDAFFSDAPRLGESVRAVGRVRATDVVFLCADDRANRVKSFKIGEKRQVNEKAKK
ncbi:MAG: hypothetical protein IKU86_02705 [Thermoguttaceae bacterium]|nr:hypothetical protein [Thermoguttaceae bacterium]